jgi:hypothetical protein
MSMPSPESIKTLGAATMPVCLLPHTQHLAVCAAQRGWPEFIRERDHVRAAESTSLRSDTFGVLSWTLGQLLVGGSAPPVVQ